MSLVIRTLGLKKGDLESAKKITTSESENTGDTEKYKLHEVFVFCRVGDASSYTEKNQSHD